MSTFSLLLAVGICSGAWLLHTDLSRVAFTAAFLPLDLLSLPLGRKRRKWAHVGELSYNVYTRKGFQSPFRWPGVSQGIKGTQSHRAPKAFWLCGDTVKSTGSSVAMTQKASSGLSSDNIDRGNIPLFMSLGIQQFPRSLGSSLRLYGNPSWMRT